MHKLKQRVLHSPAWIISSTERSVCVAVGGGVRYRKIRQIRCCKYSFCFSDCNIQTAVIVSAETSQRLTTEPDNSSANTLSGRELHPGSCGPTTWSLRRITRQIHNLFFCRLPITFWILGHIQLVYCTVSMQLTLFLFTLNTTFHLSEPELCQISASIISSRLLMLARSVYLLTCYLVTEPEPVFTQCAVLVYTFTHILVLFTDTVF